jgi:LmbE family N-acetylglucosaminyl deacetylase
MNTKKVLVVEILGCGGTVSRLVDENHEVYALILGEGVTSRDAQRNCAHRRKEIGKLKAMSLNANKIIGVKKVFTCDFPDNRFDTVPLLDIVKSIEKVKQQIKPDILFTHYEKDLNLDHRLTYNAVLTATRPLAEETVKEIYSFEVVSSTECNYPLSFSPDYYVNIEKYYEKKMAAMKIYAPELRPFPHTRSEEFIMLNSRFWGVRVGCLYAEAFKTIRVVK